MNKKALGLIALTFIPATLAGNVHSNVGFGFRIGNVDLGMVFNDECPCADDCSQECHTCSRMINSISDGLFEISWATPSFRIAMDNAGICRSIYKQIASRLWNIRHEWLPYINHCCCTCPKALEEIKDSVWKIRYDMAHIKSCCYWQTQDNALELRDALDHLYYAMQNRVPTDHLADDFAECARCMRRL